jgi:hypothetical protein
LRKAAKAATLADLAVDKVGLAEAKADLAVDSEWDHLMAQCFCSIHRSSKN